MKKKRPALQKGITGIVLADQWDESGNVIGVSVYTDREEVYIVAQNERIKELIRLVQPRVRVSGGIKEESDGKKFLHVETVRTFSKENER